MKAKVILTILLNIVLTIFIHAQTLPKVNESETKASFENKQLQIDLAIENLTDNQTAKIKLEILDIDDKVLANSETSNNLRNGKQNLPFLLNLETNSEDLLWKRLRCTISNDLSTTSTIISLSQILPEIFDLKSFANYVNDDSRYRIIVQTFNPVNDLPVKDVAIDSQIEIKNGVTIKASGKTSGDGYAILEFNLPKFTQYDDLTLKIEGSKNGITRKIEEELPNRTFRNAYLQTDKPIYQPNQNFNLRIYYVNMLNKPASNIDLEVEIEGRDEDGDSETVFRDKVKTSRFGLANVVWKIPETIKLGNYDITVREGSESGPIGYEKIKITRYEVPNFYVEASPDQKFYLPEQKTAKVEINTNYLFGKAVENAKVRIVADDKDNQTEIIGTTDSQGKFTAEIDLTKAHDEFEPDNWKRFSDLHWMAFVTNPTNNRTEQKRFDLRLTKEPIHIYLIGETYRQSQLLPLKYYVTTFYADGTPAECEVEVFEKIEKDLDGKPIPAELGKQFAKIKTNKYGAARLTLPLQFDKEKGLTLRLIARDKKNKKGINDNEISLNNEPIIQIETDKMIYRQGEPIEVSVKASQSKGKVYIDLIKDSEILKSIKTKLSKVRTEITIPYDENFRNAVTLYAYFEDGDEIVSANKTIVFPTPSNLKIDAKIKNVAFRPGEETTVKFNAKLNGKSPETALGVLILDRAIEERARTESEFGRENNFLNRNFTSNFINLLGFNAVFGKFSRYDIENLDLSKEIDKDLELAVEIAYREGYSYEPKIYRSESMRELVEKAFDPYFRKLVEPIKKSLTKTFNEKDLLAKDENSLREILQSNGINLSDLRDPWGNPLQTEFRYDKKNLMVELWSLGADKTAKTSDDLTVFEDKFLYFVPTGKLLNSALSEYTQRTGDFITDYQTLREELLKKNFDLDKLRDPWGNSYRFEFLIDRTNKLLSVKTNGVNGTPDVTTAYENDDVELWSYSADYFAVTRAKIRESFYRYVDETKKIPHDETELKNILRDKGFNLDKMLDAFGRPYYIQRQKDYRLARYFREENNQLKAVKQLLVTFSIRSSGKDGLQGNYDDFELISFDGATHEEEIPISEAERDFSNARRIFRQNIPDTKEGAIGGTVVDLNGAVIPNADVTVKNTSGSFTSNVRSNNEGYFAVQNLPKGEYELRIYASGFKTSVYTNLSVLPSTLLELDVILEVGAVTEMVTVTSDAPLLQTSSASFVTNPREVAAPNFDKQPSFTPRVREYFPETLVWKPELITDKNGNAEVKFKFADNLTTWKLYAIGSTEKGELGVVEKELKTFQPFFAELDPPKILTEGDEIALPVTVRNYTGKPQKVSVAMAENSWSKLIEAETRTLVRGQNYAQNIEVLPDKSANAIFNFRATAPIKGGKQKVTAFAGKEADAVEKPVTVRPNGFENIENQSQMFSKSALFNVNFPQKSFPNSRQANLKIYPNLLSHVAESVNGLLKRPYGCGEQTLSSTYPNLLILKLNGKLKNVDEAVLKTARWYLQEGYKRMLNYQTKEGAYSYWGNDPNLPLTAYALRFLHDAGQFVEVDERVTERMQEWLLSQQSKDGSWQNEAITAYIVRSLSLDETKDKDIQTALRKGLEFLQKSAEKSKDDYVLANVSLALYKSGEKEMAKIVAEKLVKTAQSSPEGKFWDTGNTPFHAWGKAASVETTALVLQSILPFSNEKDFGNAYTSGLAFIIKNKDYYGVWYSTQTTVNVLDMLILAQEKAKFKGNNEKTEIFVNGKKVQEVLLNESGLRNPTILDISQFLTALENTVEIKGTGNSPLTMAQIVTSHFSEWKDAKLDSEYFQMKVNFDKTQAKIGEEITCNVEIERKNNANGMVLAEIGIPPGADVDRGSLEKSKGVDSYDILPDKIVVYFWSGKEKKNFSFSLKPRYGINALSSSSLVYDYYNPEAKAIVSPVKFEVK